MRNGFWDEIGDTLFAVAVAVAVGIGGVSLAIQVNKDRAALDAAAASQTLGLLVDPAHAPGAADTHIAPAS
jgi:hypothetical protein